MCASILRTYHKSPHNIKNIGLPPAEDDSEAGVFEGRVLIARHPIHDPAHMRAFQAKRAPPLRAFLRDRAGVLFFSSQGPRSPASLLSNGDLDGDMYFVCMNPDIVAAARPVTCVLVLSMTRIRNLV